MLPLRGSYFPLGVVRDEVGVANSGTNFALLSRISAAACGMVTFLIADPAAACTVSQTVTTQLGTYSPGAVRAKAVPALQSRAGLKCGTALLVLLNGNYIRATVRSANGFKLLRTGGGSIAYKASADAGGAYPFTQGSTINYLQNNLLNLLGLLGGSTADLPFFVRPDEATLPPVGVYKDRITIDWDWNMCNGGIGLLGICLGDSDVDTGRSVVDVTLSVTPVTATIAMSTATLWDPVNGATYPKAIPGSRGSVSVVFANPDIVPLDGGPVEVVVPTPDGSAIALGSGDGWTGPAIELVEGSPASSMTLRYTDAGDAGDDVDFSADAGRSWAYLPVAGNAVSEQAVTHVRVRGRGTMAKTSSFAVRVSYRVR